MGRIRDPREQQAYDVLDALARNGNKDRATLQGALQDDYGFSAMEAATYFLWWQERPRPRKKEDDNGRS